MYMKRSADWLAKDHTFPVGASSTGCIYHAYKGVKKKVLYNPPYTPRGSVSHAYRINIVCLKPLPDTLHLETPARTPKVVARGVMRKHLPRLEMRLVTLFQDRRAAERYRKLRLNSVCSSI